MLILRTCRAAVLAVATLALLTGACNDSDSPTEPPSDSISIESIAPASSTILRRGTQVTITVIARYTLSSASEGRISLVIQTQGCTRATRGCTRATRGCIRAIRGCTRASASFTKLQPAALKSGASQTFDDGRTLPHQSPYQARPVVFDHHHNRTLIKTIITVGNPALPLATA